MTKEKTVLITGGAGYIGTNIVQKLAALNFNIVVVDNFSNSKDCHINFLRKLYPEKIKIYSKDLLDIEQLKAIFKDESITDVIHLAGKKYVFESFEKEDEYYKNNITATKNLLDVMDLFNVKSFIFPSSITVYGNSDKDVLLEDQELNPTSPYAKQKQLCEQLIKQWQAKTNSKAIVLRLTNPIGANKQFGLFNDPIETKFLDVLTYIIKNAKENKLLTFNGNNHNTKDGTTVRDYISVEDVANAFINALKFNKAIFEIINIGSGEPGYSVLELLHQTEKSMHKKIDYTFGEKRIGDVSKLVSNNKKAKELLNFKITKSLKDIVESLL